MRRIFGIVAVACVVTIGHGATSAHAQGAIQKCIGTDGKVTYQDTACAAGRTAGQVKRDTRAADPEALQRAAADQARADKAAETRAGIAAAENARKIIQPDSMGEVSPPAEPQYIYLGDLQQGVHGVGGSAKYGKSNGRAGLTTTANSQSQGTMLLPDIMQSPAPCNTAQCRKNSGNVGGHAHSGLPAILPATSRADSRGAQFPHPRR